MIILLGVQMISGIVFYLDLYGEAFWAVDIDDQLLPINPGSMEERISKSGKAARMEAQWNRRIRNRLFNR